MCGDLYCRSCGPAQGNDRCPFCGAWSADGGCEQPAICAAYQAAADEAEYQEYVQSEAYSMFLAEKSVED